MFAQIRIRQQITRAVSLKEQGEYAEALGVVDKACKLCRAKFGEEHPCFVSCLRLMAELYNITGDYNSSEHLIHQVIHIQSKVFGEESREVAQSLDRLATVYQALGNYSAAESDFKRALEIKRQTLGEDDLSFAASLNNLGFLYKLIGKLDVAKSHYQRAEKICARVVGTDNPQYAAILNNLGTLHRAAGAYIDAERLFQQSLVIRKEKLVRNHPDYAQSLNNLGTLYIKTGKLDEGFKLLNEALEIRRRSFGENHPSFAVTLNNLAWAYLKTEDTAQVERCYMQAVEIWRNTLGGNHPNIAASLNNLASLYQSTGNYLKAEPLFRQALEIRRSALGERHPLVAESLDNLACLYAATNRSDEGLNLMEQAAHIDGHTVGQVFSISSENQRMMYLERIQFRLYRLLSLVLHTFSDSPSDISLAFDIVLRRKAIGAEAIAAQRDAVLAGKYPDLASRLRELNMLRMQIVQKTLAGPGTEDLSAYQNILKDWNARKDRIQAELAQLIPEMNLEEKLRAADRQAIALTLPEGAALVEFVRFDVFDFRAIADSGQPQWQPARYIAFILPAREPDNVAMVDLGDAEAIDQMISTFRRAITGEDTAERGAEAEESAASESSQIGLKAVGIVLRRAIFDSIEESVNHCSRMLIAPDGDLTRLPFEVLPTDDGRYLADNYRISYLSVGRDVLRFGTAFGDHATTPLVIADPDFDLDDTEAAHTKSNSTGPERSRLSRDLNGDSMRFGRLPGSRIEGQRVAQMMNVEPWLAEAALEARLKEHPSPRILHMATHGFFLEDQQRDLNKEQHTLETIGAQEDDGLGRFSGSGLENPLLRSGLALAGVNTWLGKRNAPAEAEDGILTAEDVSGLDLLGTELVVLSACETGLGEIHVGEGVFGLRRAFILAGTKTLVMSLWKVSDLSTAILMERFYENLLDLHLERDESLRRAQFYTRDITIGQIRECWLKKEVIEQLAGGDKETARYLKRLSRKNDDYQPFLHPYYWGAFVCQGDLHPLRQTTPK